MNTPGPRLQAFPSPPGVANGGCPKCHSPSLILERAGGVWEGESETVTLMKCLSCGERVDPVILAHRAQGAHPHVRGERLGPNTRWGLSPVHASER